MPAIRGITISVGYAEVLAITLVRNLRHMTECLVVTSPEDEATQAVVRSVPGARLHITDAFTRHGAKFNKGLGMEEGLQALGRHGWLAIWDADCLWPDVLPLDRLRVGALHGARRRILDDPGQWHPGLDWSTCPHARDGAAPIGFFQLFAADDPVLVGRRPWYEVSFPHAGGGDHFFTTHWPRHNMVILPFDVLHLGPVDTHWFGTDQAGKDMMAKFVYRNGWTRAMAKHSRESAERGESPPARVEVPGYAPTTYELPFVKRARQGR